MIQSTPGNRSVKSILMPLDMTVKKNQNFHKLPLSGRLKRSFGYINLIFYFPIIPAPICQSILEYKSQKNQYLYHKWIKNVPEQT